MIFVLHSIDYFSFIFSNRIILIPFSRILKNEIFLLEKKYHGPWVSFLKPKIKLTINL